MFHPLSSLDPQQEKVRRKRRKRLSDEIVNPGTMILLYHTRFSRKRQTSFYDCNGDIKAIFQRYSFMQYRRMLMIIDLYTDYACPFCFIQRKTIQKLGVDALFEPQFMEIHPQVPMDGTALEDIASKAYVERIKAQLEESGCHYGIQLQLGSTVFNSRRAIVLRAFLCARYRPETVEAYDTLLYRAYNVEGKNIASPAFLQLILDSLGLPIPVEAALADPSAQLKADQVRARAITRRIQVTPSLVWKDIVYPGLHTEQALLRFLETHNIL